MDEATRKAVDKTDKIMPCQYCQAPCEADWVDVDVGVVQCGPFHCLQCGASEIGPCDEERKLTDQEKKTGWYAPGSPPGSSVNVIGGKIVSAEQMRSAYEVEFTGNPLWGDAKYVAEWYRRIRT